ncbi:unnamed protein product [Rhizoctonia solani]|uniref:Uncharacterized protein n=1 Tax=Rhizoctonia solani TaxID=456999 RepID=A0A8H3B0J9_9AGAM|nr:unnamed protein product [Rhizoctonia solani]
MSITHYQYSALRLPTCPLTIHAILHVPFYLRRTGPLWASWAFVMERFCGYLLPAVKNRLRPYENLDNFIHRRAQMRMVSVIHNLPSLSVTPLSKHHTEEGFELSSREVYYPLCPTIILGIPIKKNVEYTSQLQNQLTKYFGPVYPNLSPEELKNGIDADSIVRYGRFRMADDGDRIRTSALIADDDAVVRDNSFVRYSLFPDANAAFRNRRDVPVQEVLYGQVHDIYFVVFVEPAKDENSSEVETEDEDEDEGELDEEQRRRKPYLLAFIEPCDTGGLDATNPATPVVKYRSMLTSHMVHIHTIEAVVGRVPQGNSWAIIDRSHNGARTVFVDED